MLFGLPATELVEDDLEPFKFTHVVYQKGDLLGKLMALLSLAPIFIMVSYATLVASRRDLRTISLVVGQLLNELLNTALKHWIKQPRPVALVRFHLGSYGMPSDHAQFMFFAAAYVLLFASLRWGQPLYARAGWCLAAVCFAAAVALSRVYLMYHTPEQILVGALVGSVAGVAWFAVTEALLQPSFRAVAETPLARWLLPTCGETADPYLEMDAVLVLVDLILLRRPVYRHLLVNLLPRRPDSFALLSRILLAVIASLALAKLYLVATTSSALPLESTAGLIPFRARRLLLSAVRGQRSPLEDAVTFALTATLENTVFAVGTAVTLLLLGAAAAPAQGTAAVAVGSCAIPPVWIAVSMAEAADPAAGADGAGGSGAAGTRPARGEAPLVARGGWTQPRPSEVAYGAFKALTWFCVSAAACLWGADGSLCPGDPEEDGGDDLLVTLPERPAVGPGAGAKLLEAQPMAWLMLGLAVAVALTASSWPRLYSVAGLVWDITALELAVVTAFTRASNAAAIGALTNRSWIEASLAVGGGFACEALTSTILWAVGLSDAITHL
ncbi:hypothetical protein FNF29_03382 [Cafeteria roenbergensis]|uniref:Multifunctional fusion protein n=1 Tax=Cafeteria roenbergensis TaxID=33653 RepID=A0A5A8CL00_CAFRO|nr:hypothetical protein FNF29_03382 [Cafeteria roenbergensis]|eukprot:KAA0153194.1 hypothetical protein FNF29_03382 [Cafeteria roenbergensis]